MFESSRAPSSSPVPRLLSMPTTIVSDWVPTCLVLYADASVLPRRHPWAVCRLFHVLHPHPPRRRCTVNSLDIPPYIIGDTFSGTIPLVYPPPPPKYKPSLPHHPRVPSNQHSQLPHPHYSLSMCIRLFAHCPLSRDHVGGPLGTFCRCLPLLGSLPNIVPFASRSWLLVPRHLSLYPSSSPRPLSVVYSTRPLPSTPPAAHHGGFPCCLCSHA